MEHKASNQCIRVRSHGNISAGFFSVFVMWDAYGNYKASEGYHVPERLAE